MGQNHKLHRTFTPPKRVSSSCFRTLKPAFLAKGAHTRSDFGRASPSSLTPFGEGPCRSETTTTGGRGAVEEITTVSRACAFGDAARLLLTSFNCIVFVLIDSKGCDACIGGVRAISMRHQSSKHVRARALYVDEWGIIIPYYRKHLSLLLSSPAIAPSSAAFL